MKRIYRDIPYVSQEKPTLSLKIRGSSSTSMDAATRIENKPVSRSPLEFKI
jgi:hypothetical protein